MISGRIRCELAVVVILCILVIVFFPAMQGPYSVVHGPVTALQAVRAALRVQAAIVQAALNSHSTFRLAPLTALSGISFPTGKSESLRLPEHKTILRC